MGKKKKKLQTILLGEREGGSMGGSEYAIFICEGERGARHGCIIVLLSGFF
jgi:hypothetical protein